MLRSASLLAAALALTLPTLAQAAEPDPARDRTMALISALSDVRPAPEDGAPTKADREHNAAAFTRLDGFFDFDRLTGDPVAALKDRFSAAQLNQYHETFRALLRMIAYPDSGEFLRKAKYTVGASRGVDGGREVVLDGHLEEEDFDTKVAFRWHTVGDTLLVYDVVFDGASLTTDYKNQFARIIDKHGVTGLLDRMTERRKKETATRGDTP